MFFSVIIPNYNHGRFLEERINSVLNQSYQNFELIILDDGSTDNSKEIIAKYEHNPKIKTVVLNSKNSGSPYLQWQKGIHLASYDWIWIAESDDVASSEFLSAAVEIVENNPEVGAYYCDSYVIDENSKTIARASEIKNNFFETDKWSCSYKINGVQELNECLKFLCTINNASAFIFKKQFFTAAENELISYKYFGDRYFYTFIALHTNIYYNNLPLSSYRDHNRNFISEHLPVIERKREHFRILQFLLGRKEVSNKQEVINFFCLHFLGWGWKKQGIKVALPIIRSYYQMNKKLALSVIPKLCWYKLRGRKNQKPYP